LRLGCDRRFDLIARTTNSARIEMHVVNKLALCEDFAANGFRRRKRCVTASDMRRRSVIQIVVH
jgi:hypothetical protein